MTSDSTRPSFSPFQAQAELELLQLILQSDTPYPWNPAESGADAYFAELEQEVIAAGWMAEDFAAQGTALATYVDQVWATIAPVEQTVTRSLITQLFERCAAQVPQAFLEDLVHHAQRAVAINASLADKLVMSVQELLPNWAEDDLRVLARPLAYAMRGPEAELETTLQPLQETTWVSLSSIDQAKLSLVIARYAIAQLSADQS
ncbi:hypothetical protein H6G89_18300 [Oscillatoria sp. FACHB-1407]|uniref:hypothetical protein n=1 Tax=Oscillatoria sp. FACHB-1407 TaxID=2692847 RepID=UPI001687550B|nr:hypothetical protein [Oscillatoria sp. FACHB-1407]MBD2462995.1 hypothetical protein [Oscillatoria sp. FACHB-1407]